MKFICKTLSESIRSNTYTTPSGNTYIFFSGQETDIINEEDIKYFKSNKRFEAVGAEITEDEHGSGAKGKRLHRKRD